MARKSRYTIETSTAKKANVLLAGVYTRLSIEDEEQEDLNSIGNQKKIILDYLKDKEDIVIEDYYVDNGYTGMNFNRPDWQRMMDDLRAGKINCVIVKDISRLGRHFVMTSEIVEKVFPMMGVRLICVNDDFDSASELSDTQALLMPFKMVMNDSYVRDISKKIRSSISAKIDQGEYLPSSSSIPYGYIRNPEKHSFDIDEEVAPVIVRIFEMKAKGMSQCAIARILNEEGIPCPGKLRYLRGITKADKYKDALWIHGTLRKILMDQVYIGNRVHGRVKRDKIGLDKTRRAEDQWTVIENAHEPIISKELFNEVQNSIANTRKQRETYAHRETVEEDNRDLLRDKVYCGECCSKMRAHKGLHRINKKAPNLDPFIYYDCGKYIDSGRLVCSTHFIHEDDIMYAIENTLNQQLKLAINLQQLLSEMQSLPKVARQRTESSDSLSHLKGKRLELEAKLERLLSDLTEGLIDKDEYAYARSKYDSEYEQALIAEQNAFIAARKYDSIYSKALSWTQLLFKYQRFPEITRQLLDQLIKRIEIHPGRHIHIILNYENPFEEVKQYIDSIPEVADNEPQFN